ncbi:RidA family protein [Nonomuraea sediminis]|uniref:RidA family protein n=1 Tax=Nonomuraea sediminis TaxID=2835864 RepID=UPI001BDBB6C6|nr:RidA family protein [Nonomuraea sediminis]
MNIKHINPDSLPRNPAFAQAVSVQNPGTLIYVGGQNGIGADGELVGADLASQAEQALRNVLAALEAAGARQENVLKLTVHVVQGHPVEEAFGAAQKVWGTNATAVTVLVVAGLANPAFLIEVDAVAAVA